MGCCRWVLEPSLQQANWSIDIELGCFGGVEVGNQHAELAFERVGVNINLGNFRVLLKVEVRQQVDGYLAGDCTCK